MLYHFYLLSSASSAHVGVLVVAVGEQERLAAVLADAVEQQLEAVIAVDVLIQILDRLRLERALQEHDHVLTQLPHDHL